MKRALLPLGLITLLLFTDTIMNIQSPAQALEEKSLECFIQTADFIPKKPFLKHLQSLAIPSGSFKEGSNKSISISQSPQRDSHPSIHQSPEKKEVLSPQPLNQAFTHGFFQNASKPLITPTYEGSGQTVHPSVIDFKLEHELDTWHGYRYWMAMTPYPYANDQFENPSLLGSQDGITWVVPEGFSKPIDILPGRANYNSDPNLVYDPDEKVLLIYWRETLDGQYDRIWRAKYPSYKKLEPKTLVLEEAWGKQKTNLALSPSVWRKNAKEWYLFTVSGNNHIQLYDSQDGVKWGNRRETQSPWIEWNGGLVPWHLEVKPNLAKQKLEIFLCGWPKGKTLFDLVLVYAEAPINDPSAITLSFEKPLLTNGSLHQWDDDFIYKSSFVREEKEGESFYHIWYSARSSKGIWRTGYTSGTFRKAE